MPPSPPPDPTATEIAQAEKARQRAIYAVIPMVFISAALLPLALKYFFGIPKMVGILSFAVLYLILHRFLKFSQAPTCPNCDLSVAQGVTHCRYCGTQLRGG